MDFQNEPLGNMVAVGLVRPRSARLWLRLERPGRVTVAWSPAERRNEQGQTEVEIAEDNPGDNTAGFELPGNAAEAQPLRPGTRYHFQVTSQADGRRVGEGSFETAPERPMDAPERFSIAVMSCNQPFDPYGRLREKSRAMLRAALRCLQQHNTKLVMTVGDQIYSDYPKKLSLFNARYFARWAPPGRKELLDCSAEEIRRLYHRRYRHFFGYPEWQQLHAHHAVCPILDDHDIVDNWGCAPYHQEAPWTALGEGARAAYWDYQGSRVAADVDGGVPASFDASMEYGPVALYALDLRSNRRAGENGQLFSGEQEARLRDFMEANGDKPVLGLVLSVPVIHLPRFIAQAVAKLPPSDEDFSDRWSTGSHLRDRDRFLRLMDDHRARFPRQHVVFLSGDIHIGCVHQIRRPEKPIAYQLVSSPITHDSGHLSRVASKWLIRLNHGFRTADGEMGGEVRLLRGEKRHAHNPYTGLNVGLLEIDRSEGAADVRLRFLLFGHRGDEPICVYRSPWIADAVGGDQIGR